jgi:hypothetical protein
LTIFFSTYQTEQTLTNDYYTFEPLVDDVWMREPIESMIEQDFEPEAFEDNQTVLPIEPEQESINKRLASLNLTNFEQTTQSTIELSSVPSTDLSSIPSSTLEPKSVSNVNTPIAVTSSTEAAPFVPSSSSSVAPVFVESNPSNEADTFEDSNAFSSTSRPNSPSTQSAVTDASTSVSPSITTSKILNSLMPKNAFVPKHTITPAPSPKQTNSASGSATSTLLLIFFSLFTFSCSRLIHSNQFN